MVNQIRIYVEGGGDNHQTRIPLRDAFSKFFRHGLRQTIPDWDQRKIGLHIIPCGSRNGAYEMFCLGKESHPTAFNILLVDAENAVSQPPWLHLREQDGWNLRRSDDRQFHLMVQTMEAWLIADLIALKKFYGKGFSERAIPRSLNVEQVNKPELERSLKKATQRTSKGEYHKIRHAAPLLGSLDNAKVRQSAPHCERLFRTLEDLLT